MLIPSARVSVANTSFTNPATKQASTASLNGGTIPAWWAASPASMPAIHDDQPRTPRSAPARPAVRSSQMARMRRRSSTVVRRRPVSRHWRTAESHAARLKMKVMAGSIPSSSRRCATS